MYLPVGKASRCPGGHQKQRTRLLYFTGDPTRAAPTDSVVDDSRRTKKGQCLTGKIKYLKLGNCVPFYVISGILNRGFSVFAFCRCLLSGIPDPRLKTACPRRL